MLSTWSDSWYGRCRFSRCSRRSISRTSPSLETSLRITPIPPKLIAPIRFPISSWIRPSPNTGFDRAGPPRALAWRAFALRPRWALFFRLCLYEIAFTGKASWLDSANRVRIVLTTSRISLSGALRKAP